jgi:translocator protein
MDKHIPKFIVAVGLCLAVSFISSVFTVPEIHGWYSHINKPTFTPPNWVFGPVWIILYTMMGIALFLVWKNTASNKREAIFMFVIQLFLNFTWSILFFYLHVIGFALIDIGLLWIFILLTTLSFRKTSVNASILLIPYLLWVTYASILNFSLWRLN